MTGVQRVEEFAAWQLADAFRSEMCALLKGSREAMCDHRFRYQLKDSASGPPTHITEGFVRFSPRDFCRFVDYALGSLREAEGGIQDGIEFGYFHEDQCRRAFWFGERCFSATLRLKQSQERDEQLERERRARSKLKKADKHQVPRTRRTRRTD